MIILLLCCHAEARVIRAVYVYEFIMLHSYITTWMYRNACDNYILYIIYLYNIHVVHITPRMNILYLIINKIADRFVFLNDNKNNNNIIMILYYYIIIIYYLNVVFTREMWKSSRQYQNCWFAIIINTNNTWTSGCYDYYR